MSTAAEDTELVPLPEDGLVSDVLWGALKSVSAKRSLLSLRNRSMISTEDGSEILAPLPQEDAWKYKGDLYTHYQAPRGFILINRSFLPSTLNENNLLKTAIDNLPTGSTQEEVNDIKSLIIDLKNAISDAADIKLEFHFSQKFREQKIKFGTSGTVQNTTDGRTKC